MHVWSPAPGRSSVADLLPSPPLMETVSELGNIVISEQGVVDGVGIV